MFIMLLICLDNLRMLDRLCEGRPHMLSQNVCYSNILIRS